MPLSLRVTVPTRRLSVHEGLEVDVAISNGDERPWELPSLYDQTGALRFELRTPSNELVARLDGLTRQAASSPGRLDYTRSLDILPPGATWSRRFDLVRYGAPPPAGEIDVTAVLDDPRAGVALRSEPVRVVIDKAPLLALSAGRDNPVLDRHTLLFAAGDARAPEHFLRLHSASRPLAAWCSTRLDVGADARRPFLASNNRFQSATFDPFFLQWVLWTDGARRLQARPFRSGKPAGPPLGAPLPAERRLLGAAYEADGGPPHVLFEAPGNVLEARVPSDAGGLPVVFARALPPFSTLVAAADREAVHVVTTHRGLVHHRLTHQGELMSTRQLLGTTRRPWHLALDGCDSLRAIFADPPHGRSVRLIHVDLRTGEVTERALDLAGHHGDVREASFARDAAGCFHFLFSTSDRRLLLYSDARGPVRIAHGEERFFPTVVAGQDLFLGYRCGGEAYHFVEHRPRGI